MVSVEKNFSINKQIVEKRTNMEKNKNRVKSNFKKDTFVFIEVNVGKY